MKLLHTETRILIVVIFAIFSLIFPRHYPHHSTLRPHDIEDRICVAILVTSATQTIRVHNIAQQVERMLRRATKPSRISICIYDQGDSARLQIPVHIQTSVKVARNMAINEPNHCSDSDARAWIVDRMLSGERYFMTVPSCFEVTENWDNTLVEMLPSADSILTAQCESFSRDVKFLVLGDIQGSRFIVVNKPCIIKPRLPVPSLFWVPSMSFCASNIMLNSPPIANGIIRNTHADATLNGIRLWTHGYNFYTPSQVVVWRHGCCRNELVWRKPTRPRYTVERTLIGDARTTREYETFAGIDLTHKVATIRARTGLTPSYDVTEARIKSGSVDSAVKAIHRA